ncbi:MAG TPA: hypothetical protein VFM02_00420 [Candidatus Paceibacterota bacterium]|nr:hypothetical protein [Candidatus Paceibacterota bacterium]
MKTFILKKRSPLLVFVMVVAITIVFLAPIAKTPRADASLLSSVFMPTFGGMVDASFYCACSGTWLLYVGPPVPALLVYANTPQYRWYQLPRPGVWALGLYYRDLGICKVPTPIGCVDIPNEGLISPTVGTSM